MSDRISEVILLCEDDPQARLIRAYLEICGQQGRVRSKVASREVQGGNVGWVIAQFPAELHACRQRSKRSKTLLIVMVDADDRSVVERQQQLLDQLVAARLDPFAEGDPVAILIPKRQVETWICNALGETVNEQDDCKTRKKPDKGTCRSAARTIHSWARPNAVHPGHLVSSLLSAMPQWRRVC